MKYSFKSLNYFSALLALTTLVGCAKFDYIASFGTSSILASCLEPAATSDFQSGTGTTVDPYVICSTTQFLNLASNTSYFGNHFIQGNDLNFSGLTFVPVGIYDNSNPSAALPFTGTYNGNNSTIQNIDYTSPSGSISAGIFAHTSGSNISALNLVNNTIRSSGRSGILLGFGINSQFSNISSSGGGLRYVSSGNLNNFGTGTMVGLMRLNNSANFTLENLANSSPIEGADRMGGIFGAIEITNGSNLTLRNSSNSGNISQPASAVGNTNGAIGGIIVANGTSGTEVRIQNVQNSGGLTTLEPLSGAWEGLLLGQLHMTNGTNNFLEISDVDLAGTITSSADWSALSGALGGITGNLALGNSTNMTVNIVRVGVRGLIQIPTPGVRNKSRIAGLLSHLNIRNSVNLNFSMNHCYFDGTIDINANASEIGGLIGRYENPGATGSSVNISNSYVNFRSFAVSGSLADSFALIGDLSFTGTANYSFNNVYYRGPNILVDSVTVAADPGDLPGYSRLTSTSILQQSSYVGAGWNFATTWLAPNGVRPPRLR